MGTFKYNAIDGSAQLVQGALDAATEREVVAWLRGRNWYPIRIEPLTGEGRASPAGALFRRGPTREDVLVFTQQLHALLEAGLEVDRSLAILADLTDAGRLRSVVRQVLTDVQGGASLGDSLAKHPRVFSRLYVNMVKAGEAGGALDAVIGRLAAFLESAKAIRDEVISALVYPSLVMAVGGGAVFFLLSFVIPRFARILADSRQLLPVSTQVLLALSTFAESYWWALAGGGLLAALAVRGAIQTERGKALWDRLALRLPVLGGLIRELEVARFVRTLGTLLQSGVPVLTALGIVTEIVTNSVMAEALPRLREGVKRGEGISGPLRAAAIFPPMAVHMARVGEESGRLEEMLIKVADLYDGRVRTSVRRLLGLLEPVLILLLGLVVGAIVLAMLMAIFSVSDLPI